MAECSLVQTAIAFPRRKTRSSARKEKLEVTPRSGNRGRNGTIATGLSQPLSPRKRLGEENNCNVPHLLECSPTKRQKENATAAVTATAAAALKSPVLTTRKKLQFEEASPHPPRVISPIEKQQDARRLGDGATAQKSGAAREKATASSARTPSTPAVLQVVRQEGECYALAKKALHTANPERLLCRERETAAIVAFVEEHVVARVPGSIYISGAPGTGKTACLKHILHSMKKRLSNARVVFLNCMPLTSSQAVYPAVLSKLGEAGEKTAGVGSRDHARQLERIVTKSGPMIVLVLDEMDQLDSRAQEVLYTMFEWPALPNSRLVLIGVANALDLTDRILPRLQALRSHQPHLINFPPYSRDQILAILQDRLSGLKEGVVDPAAVQFCARKVSAMSGDARKALDVCRRAVEKLGGEIRKQTVLSPNGEGPVPTTTVPRRVTLPQISAVLSEVYGSPMASRAGDHGGSFPLQQKLLVITLLMLVRSGKVREFTFGKIHETYTGVCQRHQMARLHQSECMALCSLLEARGILTIKNSKEARLMKVSLKIDQSDVEHALQDKVLLSSILQAGIPK
ncbi:cell division control protein 6 homolog [Petromyzon marinus]|uniref:cell division control protein 6 homolog n=1 Tax=Petromyzon marinus TaxID=7757 RepID=UPI003F72818D